MKKILTLTALGILCGTLTGCMGFPSLFGGYRYANAAQYAVGDFEYAADAVSRVCIHWTSGTVELVRGAGETLSVSESGALLTDPQKLHWQLADGTLYIEFAASGYVGSFPLGAKQLRVELPDGIALEVEAVSAAVQADALTLDTVKLGTTSGSVQLETLTAEKLKLGSVSGAIQLGSVETREKLEIGTTSGAVRAERLHAAALKIGTVSGKIELDEAVTAGDCEFSTTSGAIDASRLECAEAEAKTVSGSVTLGLAVCADAEVKTTSGKVCLTLLDGLGATVDYDTTSGKFDCSDYRVSGGKPTFGDGACSVAVKTVSGGLTVE